jgi:RNA polymerase sigma-70 factor (ECF subfamily)
LTNRQQDSGERFLRHLEPLQGALESYCRRVLYRRSDVEDVLQSAVANALRDFHLYVEGTNFRAWMFRYVDFEAKNRNRAIRRARDHGPLPELAAGSDWQSVLEQTEWPVLLDEPERVLDYCDQELDEAVRGLPETEQRVFLLRALGDFKYREIAEILDVPVGTVMGTLSRARARLRRSLYEFARRPEQHHESDPCEAPDET